LEWSFSICLDFLQTMILLISAFPVARIAGVTQQCPAIVLVYNLKWETFPLNL
jgi:hypothetical protein